jgi:hypothetical protein
MGVVSRLAIMGLMICAGGLTAVAALRENPAPAQGQQPDRTCCGHLLSRAVMPPSAHNLPRVAQAGQGNEPRISVAVVPGVSSRLGLEQYIDGRTAYKFVMIKGLPPGFSMSAGFPTRNTWVVSFNDVQNLQLTAPGDFKGSVTLEVAFMKMNEDQPDFYYVDVLTRSTDRAAVRPQQENQVPTSAWNRPEQEPAPAPRRSLTQAPPAEEEALLTRAMELLRKADVAAARLLYETLAVKGSARAAFAMGQTYDPDFLKGIGVQRLANVETARRWYKKAMELGSREAEIMLSTLN